MKVVILAGGRGSRLWPLSNSCCPKQFLAFQDGSDSLFQMTLRRFLKRFSPHDILIVSPLAYREIASEQAEHVAACLKERIAIEPQSKNTAPALLFALEVLEEKREISQQECIVIAPCDHLIELEESFLDLLEEGGQIAKTGWHVAFGVKPTRAETGYGYIKVQRDQGSAWTAALFVEKPDRELAEQYLANPDFVWNAGIFVFHVATLIQDFKEYAPVFLEKKPFSELPALSIDQALMQKSQRIKVLQLNGAWSDVGSWDSVYEHFEKDADHHAHSGSVVSLESRRCFALSHRKLIALLGVEDLLIIETEEALLIAKRGESQKVKELLAKVEGKIE